MSSIHRYILLVVSVLFSVQVYSLSCIGITEEFYFSCENQDCVPVFQVSFKKFGGSCKRRPVVSEINESFGSYISSELVHSNISNDGFYKLGIRFGYWSYEPSSEIESFKNTISRTYGHEFIDPESGELPIKLDVRDLLSSNTSGIVLDYLGKQESMSIDRIKQDHLSAQYYGLGKYVLYILIYWGTSLLCLISLVYSVNRFYRCINSEFKIDKKAVCIQVLVLLVCLLSIVTMSWEPWAGTLLLPAVVVILIAEFLAMLKAKNEGA